MSPLMDPGPPGVAWGRRTTSGDVIWSFHQMRRLLFILLFASLSAWCSATHVLGGEMYYDKLAGDQYRITLRLFRDCGPNNVNGTGFDAQAVMAVYDGNGALQFTTSPSFTVENDVVVELNSPCLQAPPSICATWAEYVAVIDLPPNATGYVISYQRCCRTPSTTNLPTGLLQGLTCTVQVPPASVGSNSSPRFNGYPPVAMCFGQDMVFDHSASDPDGDVLVYDLFSPYAGGSANDPAPVAGPPPYAPIQWAAGYDATDPMDADPGLAIDPLTGELTVHPTVLGSYAAAVRVREYRNGELLSASIRDVRFDVVACDAFIASVMAEQTAEERCTGLTMPFSNESINGQSWHWDFGVAGTDADTSDLLDPEWTYADTGSYTVTLIANPGWPCADTSTSQFAIHYPLEPSFIRPPIACVDASVQFQADGRFTPLAAVSWSFGEGDAPVTGSGIITTTAFAEPGTFPVQLVVQEFGCEASYLDSATAHPRILLEAVTDTAGCVDTPFAFTAQATAWSPVAYSWTFGDGTGASDTDATHVYVEAGEYDVSVTASTSAGCVDTRTIVMPDQVQVFPKPTPEFTVYPNEVSLLAPVVEVTDHAQGAVAWEYAIAGERLTGPSFSFEFDDAGWFDITQTVRSGTNCEASITRTVYVSDHLFYAPSAFTPDGDGVNDIFLPVVRGARLYDLIVVDRWGVERFHTTDPLQGWSGDGLPQGTYGYKVRLSEYGPMSTEYVGHFTLLR